jgi:hypothetical protein
MAESAADDEAHEKSRHSCGDYGMGGVLADEAFSVGMEFAQFDAGILPLFVGCAPEMLHIFSCGIAEMNGALVGDSAQLAGFLSGRFF